MLLFEIKDKSGRTIYLTQERWKHISKEHPNISGKIEEIKNILTNPVIITESEKNVNVKFYYKYYKKAKFKKYLLVIVRYLNGKGFIITSFYIDKIQGIK